MMVYSDILSTYFHHRLLNKDVLNHNNTVYSDMTKAETGAVIGLVARDPRLTLPTQRGRLTEAEVKTTEDDERVASDWSLQQSGLWSSEVRDSLSRLSDHEVNKARQEARVNEVAGSVVSALIIATEDGWDLVVPPGWAVNTWIGLVYTGVKVLYCTPVHLHLYSIQKLLCNIDFVNTIQIAFENKWPTQLCIHD